MMKFSALIICALMIGFQQAAKVTSFAPGLTKITNRLLINDPSITSHRFIILHAWGQKKKDNQTEEPFKSEISEKRKKQLGIVDEREYDLDVALATNTDPLITKVIAGSFILVVMALLIAGIVVPSLTDYGEGVCNPIRSAGRC